MGPHSRPQHGTFLLPQAVVLLLSRLVSASHEAVAPSYAYTDTPFLFDFRRIKATVIQVLIRLVPFADRGSQKTSAWLLVGMVKLTAICGIGSSLYVWSKSKNKSRLGSTDEKSAVPVGDDAASTDPGLLKKHSSIQSYTVPSTGITYPEIRIIHRSHAQQTKLPQKPSPIPLLVFIHGLGGSAAQFHPILTSLATLAPTLAIDLPGCGLSSFAPKAWEAYTTDALAHLVATVIEAHRDHAAGQGVVLVGHSMGCSLATLLGSKTSPHASLISNHVLGFVAICPQAEPPDEKHAKAAWWATSIPAPVFDLMRRFDRRGGINSKSVLRMAGAGAEEETKELQLRFNRQSRTPVWQRMAYGALSDLSNNGGLPGKEVWAGLGVPVFLVGGEADVITPFDNVRKIAKFLGRNVAAIDPPSEKASLPIAAAPVDPAVIAPEVAERKHQDSGVDADDLPKEDGEGTVSEPSLEDQTVINTEAESITEDDITVNAATPESTGPAPHPCRLLVKTTILPKPASHALLYAPSSSRTLSGLISTFLSDHIDPRLSLGWQLQYLTTEGKWDVKNFRKWQAVQAVSHPIARTFRAMKTLREVDDEHSPKQFVKTYTGRIHSIIDISHDSPVYDPKGLQAGGITYYKFPTVSKLPPTNQETHDFIALLDRVRAENHDRPGLIGVHCHYGFNRTGFFLVCYMVERLGYSVEDAIAEFAAKRLPGIRHAHFIDALHVKYCVGLRRAPTL